MNKITANTSIIALLFFASIVSSADVNKKGNRTLETSNNEHLSILKSIKKRDKELRILSLKVEKLESAVQEIIEYRNSREGQLSRYDSRLNY